jgi:hypothetical protein
MSTAPSNVEHNQAGGRPNWFDVMGRNGGAISIGQTGKLGEIVLFRPMHSAYRLSKDPQPTCPGMGKENSWVMGCS